MRFQLTATPKSPSGGSVEIEAIAVVFTAPTWSDAQAFGDLFMSEMPERANFASNITYADQFVGGFRSFEPAPTKPADWEYVATTGGHKIESGSKLTLITGKKVTFRRVDVTGKYIVSQEPGDTEREWQADRFINLKIERAR